MHDTRLQFIGHAEHPDGWAVAIVERDSRGRWRRYGEHLGHVRRHGARWEARRTTESGDLVAVLGTHRTRREAADALALAEVK